MHLLFAAILAVTQQWLLVSDLHVDPFAPSAAPSTYHADTNWALFDSTVAQMRRAAPNARVVAISGDFLAHHFEAKARAAGQQPAAAAEQTMARIERAFAKTFPRAQFLITLGNNDDPCGDYRTAPGTPYLAALARIWAPLVNRNGTSPDFARDFASRGSYIARLPGGMRAVAVDDVYWSFVYRPCGRVAPSQPNSQLAWLSKALDATPSGVRDVVLMHIPPGVDSSSTLLTHRFIVVPFLRSDMREGLVGALARNSARIAFVLAGHTHRSDFRIAGGVPVLIAPAVSPVYANNPAFIAMDVEPSGTLRDYRVYAYSEEDGAWSPIFDYAQAYGVAPFDAVKLAAVHAAIGNGGLARDRWAHVMVGNSDAWLQIRRSWRAFWCAQTDFGGQYAGCAGDQRRVVFLPVALALAVAAVVAVVALIFLRLARQRRAR